MHFNVGQEGAANVMISEQSGWGMCFAFLYFLLLSIVPNL